jgi:Xaa-Pro aminopeptidase
MIKKEEFAHRRAKVFQQMKENSVVVIPTFPNIHHSTDEYLNYVPDYDFYYLTGFVEPEAIAVLLKSEGEEKFILFNRKKDPLVETWLGRRVGQDDASEELGVNEAYPIDEFTKRLPGLLTGKNNLYYPVGRYLEFEKQISEALFELRFKVRAGVSIPNAIINIEEILSELRLFKSDAELDLMRTANRISVDAHLRAMKAARPGVYEYEVAAELNYEFQRRGCSGYAYPSIVAGGVNACTLHYIVNNQKLRENELLLIDAGGKYQFYCADITRTFPISGKFTDHQKALYEVVLKAQLLAIEQVKPENSWMNMSEIADRTITEGLVDLGILKGNVDDLIEQKAFKPFYMHRIGHWLGIDVHDVGQYKTGDTWRAFEPGMVTTVEPGLYIQPGSKGVDEAWWGIGIRIEDNVLVTKDGHENFTEALPKTVEDVEAAVKG